MTVTEKQIQYTDRQTQTHKQTDTQTHTYRHRGCFLIHSYVKKHLKFIIGITHSPTVPVNLDDLKQWCHYCRLK